MPHNMRYPRYGGFRRAEGAPYMSQFGYGGAGYGGFGRQGMYGGWRSNYPYGQQMNYQYPVNQGPTVNMNRYSTTANFIFAILLIGLIIVGVYLGIRAKRAKNLLQFGGTTDYYSPSIRFDRF